MDPAVLDEILTRYFHSWSPYRLIVARLRVVHGLRRSLRWLKQQFKRLELYRRSNPFLTPVAIVRNSIQHYISGSGSLSGYRTVWKVLRDHYKLNVKRDTVMRLMQEISPFTAQRRHGKKMKRRVYISKGPNFAWHVDQYDKLSRYGFHIHGCIDGFSRKVMWFKIGPTNRDPAVVVSYYLETIESVGGCPRVICSDRGVENSKIAESHIAFRLLHSDHNSGNKSYRYVTSPRNSRIESWWSQLRRHKSDWWIEHFRLCHCKGSRARWLVCPRFYLSQELYGVCIFCCLDERFKPICVVLEFSPHPPSAISLLPKWTS
jgi:hypothetical protein